jgi:hypothetical protein
MAAFLAAGDQARGAQYLQVGAGGGKRLAGHDGELIHGFFALAEQAHDFQALRAGKCVADFGQQAENGFLFFEQTIFHDVVSHKA